MKENAGTLNWRSLVTIVICGTSKLLHTAGVQMDTMLQLELIEYVLMMISVGHIVYQFMKRKTYIYKPITKRTDEQV